jgi:hypothetical protein
LPGLRIGFETRGGQLGSRRLLPAGSVRGRAIAHALGDSAAAFLESLDRNRAAARHMS